MIIGDRLRALREAKKYSQGDIEKRTGLLRCYISRVENGHTVPAIETLEKIARALECPLYQLFYEGGNHRNSPGENRQMTLHGAVLAKRRVTSTSFARLLSKSDETDRKLLLQMAQKMAVRHPPPP